ncbi:MAG TPA: flavodoxin family protein [Lachnospiraceae bacterium]|jgi:multimeric flavodoxin WrbA|nr:flavodoxin family protein [Lachnospiraceae bacterium]
MKILIINGSPKGDNSNTMKLTRAFIEGLGNAEVREVSVSKMQITPCKGCFGCWIKTPGKCIIQDDMESVIESQLWADIIIWSFPLYYFNIPGAMKNVMDRQLPMALPDMIEVEGNVGNGSHPARYDMSGKKYILISTCGFYTAEKNYDSVLGMFDHLYGRGVYETIFCGQGELFRVPEAKEKTDAYLEAVKRAGAEFAAGGITSETHERLRELLFPREVFEAETNAMWERTIK